MQHDPTPSPPSGPRRLARAEGVLLARLRGFCVVLEDAHDPHNVSAVLRTCDALGIQDVHLVAENESESILNPKVSVGAHRWLTVYRHRGASQAIDALRKAGYDIFVSHLGAQAASLEAVPATGRAAYVFGNEKSGVTAQWLDAADTTFVIPTSGFSGSLNLSVAVALTVYDRRCRRAAAGLPAGDLDAAERAALRRTWYAGLAHGSEDRQREYAAYLGSGVAPQFLPATNRSSPARPHIPPADRP